MSAPDTSPAAPAALDDAKDRRGFHLKRLFRKPLTWLLIVAFTVVAGGLSVLFFGPVAGAVLAVIAFALGPITVYAIAGAKAGEDFFAAYAKAHGLSAAGRGALPETTPLLRRGSSRFAEHSLSGPLAEGVDGTVALYRYELESNEARGTEGNRHEYTVGLVDVPECAELVPELYCQRRDRNRSLTEVGDGLPAAKQPVALESAALDETYEIFSGPGQDPGWLRQLFAPTFIVWLTDSAPPGFGFELVNGSLCCYVDDYRQDDDGLDTMRAATAAVTNRLRDESLE